MEQQVTHQRLVKRAMVKLVAIGFEAAVTGAIANMVEQAGVGTPRPLLKVWREVREISGPACCRLVQRDLTASVWRDVRHVRQFVRFELEQLLRADDERLSERSCEPLRLRLAEQTGE